MKILLRKLSQKKVLRILLIFLLIGLAYVVYAVIGINRNVQKMDAAAKETVEYFPEYPKVNMTGKDPLLIQHGEYLSKAGDCIACHTNSREKGKPFAGGLPMHTPFGTIYSPNITPDKETGIGNWTDEQFIKAMREGISPHGTYYYPAFPYLYFNKLTTENLLAIKAYLDSLEPVKQKNRDNEMLFPFNWRFLQLGWRIMFFNPENKGPFVRDPHKSEEINRGAYLAVGLGHCAMCHTPSYYLFSSSLPLGAPMRKYELAGAKVQGYLAPNISEKNLEKVPINEIVDVFTKDKLIGGGKVEGPMLEVNHNSLRYLSQEDLEAIAHYLKSVVSETPPKPKSSGGPGKALYEEYCSGCHATGSGGAPKFGEKADWDPIIKKGMDNVYIAAIKGIGGMPAKGTCLSCSDEEVKQAVVYMIDALTGGAVRKAPVAPKVPQLTLADGKRVYDANCSVCHNAGFKNAPKPGDKKAWENIIDTGFVNTYLNVVTGRQGHPVRGACENCSDEEIKAAVKYMMQESSTGKDFSLW